MERIDTFHDLHKIGKRLSLHYIRWNNNLKIYEENYSTNVKIRMLFVTITIGTYVSLTIIPFICKTNSNWNKTDILFGVMYPILLASCIVIILYPYVYQKNIIKVLDDIYIIDLLLYECRTPDIRGGRAIKVVKFLAYMYDLIILQTIIISYIFCLIPELRQYLIFGCLAPFCLYHSFCTTSYKAILLGRMHRLKQFGNNTAQKNVSKEKCFMCTNNTSNGDDICFEDLLKLINNIKIY